MSKQYIMKNGRAVVVSDEVYEILKRSDRQIKYVEKDLKETRYIINKRKRRSRRFRAVRTRSTG